MRREGMLGNRIEISSKDRRTQFWYETLEISQLC